MLGKSKKNRILNLQKYLGVSEEGHQGIQGGQSAPDYQNLL
jgi:hypothetical protein